MRNIDGPFAFVCHVRKGAKQARPRRTTLMVSINY